MVDHENCVKKAKELVAKMSLKEMCSQLLYDSPAISRLNIPAYNWWNEALHGAARSGTATVFPQAIGLAAMFDPSFLKCIGSIVADEQRAKYNAYSSKGDRGIYKGLTVWSPNVNIFRDPRWGRGQETYGEDPYLSSVLATAYIKGLQGDGCVLKTAACVKHFAAHSGPEPERHHFNAEVSCKDLEETYFPAFKAAIEKADVNAVMGAYSMLNGQPCCGTSLIESLIREKWGFKGMFISDCWAIRDFHEQHKITKTPEESAALAINCGCDLNCGCTYNFLEKAVQKGLISKQTVKKACERVFTTRFELGLFDGKNKYDDIDFSVIFSKEHENASLSASRKSIVLLKNDGLLPLSLEKRPKIGIIGPNADSIASLHGNYHGTSARYCTILEGFRSILGDEYVYYSQGCALIKDKVERLALEDDRIAEAVTVAELSDAVVLCLGLDETVEGEMHDDGNGGIAGDKKDLFLPKPQRKLLDSVAKVGKPIILVLLSGGALDPAVDTYPQVKALLQAWYPGEFGGKALCETVFGLNNPSGKLPVTFYKGDTVLPDYDSYSMKGRTYRYFEGTPLYPFAFGLSYTRFEYSCASYFDKSVSFMLSNKGGMDGEEISFCFIGCSDHDAPLNPRLCGFTRTYLEVGESKWVTIKLDEDLFTLVNDKGERYERKGEWELFVGGHQKDALSCSLAKTDVAMIKINKE